VQKTLQKRAQNNALALATVNVIITR